MRLYNFLSTEHALSNLRKRRIRISRLADLNDPFELLAVNVGGKKDFRAKLRSWKAEMHNTKGILCFSKDWHNPVLWSHYAAKHHGICLGFDVPDGYAKEVIYSTDRITSHLSEDDELQPDEAFIHSLLYTKYSHWAYESEARIFVGLDAKDSEDGSYFLPFSSALRLRHVILGPLCEVPIEDVRALIRDCYTDGPIYVDKARLAFKWFKVVEDERYRAKAVVC